MRLVLSLPTAVVSSWSSSLSLTEVSGDTSPLRRAEQMRFLSGPGVSTGLTSAAWTVSGRKYFVHVAPCAPVSNTQHHRLLPSLSRGI